MMRFSFSLSALVACVDAFQISQRAHRLSNLLEEAWHHQPKQTSFAHGHLGIVLAAGSRKSSEDTEVPSMDWLTDSLKNSKDPSDVAQKGASASYKDFEKKQFIQEIKQGEDGEKENIPMESPIPFSGVSIMDKMEEEGRERFETELVHITALKAGVQAAQIVTSAVGSPLLSYEPVRYIIKLTNSEIESVTEEDNAFVMIDVPPFSDELVAKLRKFMSQNTKSGQGRLTAMLITSKDAMHYDEAPAMYSMRRADLAKWKAAFPDMFTTAYRLDTPRDCKPHLSQVMDGYSPHALDMSDSKNIKFVETGRPLVVAPWDHDVAQDVMMRGKAPPESAPLEDEHLYTPEAIREREEGKHVLALFTPGRTWGSVSYVFPQLELCCSGYTIPVEDTRQEGHTGLDSPGPLLDCRGYITTSKTGISKQMESARQLIKTYGDRFSVILASSGDPLFVDDGSVEYRKKCLLEIVNHYEKIGNVYEQLGIVNSEED